MERSVFKVILFAFIGGFIPLKALAIDNQVMDGLQKLLTEANEKRAKLDGTLTEAIGQMQSTEVNSSKTYLLETSLLNHEAKITLIKEKMSQNRLVIEFLNAFISAMDGAKDARLEAPRILGEMAHKQLLESVEVGQESKLWHFEINLSIAIKNFMEPSEKFADFLRDFMGEPANLERPGSLSDFFEKRKYINGKQAISNPAED